MNGLLETFFNLQVMQQYLPKVIEGMGITLVLSVAVVLTGLALGFALGVLRSLRIRPINMLIVLFADVFRAVPPLVILIIIYFAFPTIGLRFSGFASAWIGLSLVLAAFAEEIVWAGILSVPRGQWKPPVPAGSASPSAFAMSCYPRPRG